jgi:hypothetical protein
MAPIQRRHDRTSIMGYHAGGRGFVSDFGLTGGPKSGKCRAAYNRLAALILTAQDEPLQEDDTDGEQWGHTTQSMQIAAVRCRPSPVLATMAAERPSATTVQSHRAMPVEKA